MKNRSALKCIYAVLLLLFCFSCTKEERSEIIREEVSKNDSSIIETTNNNQEIFKYIINRRSGKVHSYEHGIKCNMSEHNKLETNDDIEEILKNENYDVCLICKAGLKLNLDKYKPKNRNPNDDEEDLSNKEVNLIKLYMNMYEFGKLDTETQKFLICIFEVGSWYVNNVWTQLGGQKSALEVDDIAESSASKVAYNKWRDYLKWYGEQYKFENGKRILPILYPKEENTDMVVYRCDLFKDQGYGYGNDEDSKKDQFLLKNAEKEIIFKEYKNYCVVDDSSKFATAVYYHYINKELLKDEDLDNRVAYGIDLWETNSTAFSKKNKFINKLYKSRKFEVITWDMLNKVKNNDHIEIYYNGEKFVLQPGDLIYRKINYDESIDGHVEFVIGGDKVVGWGRVNNKYTISKSYEPNINGYYSNDSQDKGQPFVTIIRFKGEK